MPEVKADHVEVVPIPEGPDGKPLEPEERPAQRVLDVKPMTQTPSPEEIAKGTGPIPLGLPTSIAVQGTAGEFASGFRHRCSLCLHFDRPAWHALKEKLDHSAEKTDRQLVNAMRAKILVEDSPTVRATSEGEDGDLDVEHALNSFGICRALTEIYSAADHDFSPAIMHPQGGCPTAPGPSGEDLTTLFRPRNKEAAAKGTRGYDHLMNLALGKKVEGATFRKVAPQPKKP